MNSSRWLVTRTPRPAAEVALLAFPFAGGTSGVFDGWGPAMPPQVEVRAVQYPGRRERQAEPAPRRMSQLLTDLERGLRGQLDRPYVLFGTSLGAVIAYEFARRVQRRGLPRPLRLIVSSARAPQLPEPLPDYRALNDAELLAELTALGTLPPALVSHAELAAASLPTMRADLELAASYQFSVTQESLDVAIDAISGADDPSVPAASVRAWAELTSAAFSMTLIPGGHALSFQSARLVTEVTAACERALRGEAGAQNP